MIGSSVRNLRIAGIACCVPSAESDLSAYHERFGAETVEKFSEMTGVFTRRLAAPEQTCSDLAFVAIQALFEKHPVRERVGVLVMVTQGADYPLPATACVLHKRLGLPKDCLCFDVNLGCSGYVYGLQILGSLMNCLNTEYGLLAFGDTAARGVSPLDRSSCMLFGDAGGATLMQKADDAPAMSGAYRTDGEGFKAIITPAGKERNRDAARERAPWGDGNIRSDYDCYINGADVMNFTISEVPGLIREFMAERGTAPDDYDALVLHQANAFIMRQVAKLCKFKMDKVPISIGRYGNTSSASIPLTLVDAYAGKTLPPLRLLLCGFGVGLSWAVMDIVIDPAVILPMLVSDDFFTEGAVSHD